MYGSGLDAYCMLGAVIAEGGLPPNRLVLVVPPSCVPPALSSQEIFTTIANHLQQLEVRVVRDAELVAMETGDEGQLSALQLRAGEGVVTLPCAALIHMHNKQVDQHLFKGSSVNFFKKYIYIQHFSAMNNAYLVFDSRLVISSNHCTNDPSIFAAGPLTKFSRKYRSDEW